MIRREDTLRREDIPLLGMAPRVSRPRSKPVMLWAVLRGDGSGAASRRLYTHSQAQRFVRLAKRLGLDLYATRFGRVVLP